MAIARYPHKPSPAELRAQVVAAIEAHQINALVPGLGEPLPTKGITCHVLRRTGRDCSVGISTRHNQVTLLSGAIPERWRDHEPDDKAPAIVFDRVVFNSIDSIHARPTPEAGYSFGGNYIVGSTDKGFPFEHPVPLHDRCERNEDTVARAGILAFRGAELVLHYPGSLAPTVEGVLEDVGRRWGQKGRGFLDPTDLTLWRQGRLLGYVVGDPYSGDPPTLVKI